MYEPRYSSETAALSPANLLESDQEMREGEGIKLPGNKQLCCLASCGREGLAGRQIDLGAGEGQVAGWVDCQKGG